MRHVFSSLYIDVHIVAIASKAEVVKCESMSCEVQSSAGCGAGELFKCVDHAKC